MVKLNCVCAKVNNKTCLRRERGRVKLMVLSLHASSLKYSIASLSRVLFLLWLARCVAPSLHLQLVHSHSLLFFSIMFAKTMLSNILNILANGTKNVMNNSTLISYVLSLTRLRRTLEGIMRECLAFWQKSTSSHVLLMF